MRQAEITFSFLCYILSQNISLELHEYFQTMNLKELGRKNTDINEFGHFLEGLIKAMQITAAGAPAKIRTGPCQIVSRRYHGLSQRVRVSVRQLLSVLRLWNISCEIEIKFVFFVIKRTVLIQIFEEKYITADIWVSYSQMHSDYKNKRVYICYLPKCNFYLKRVDL